MVSTREGPTGKTNVLPIGDSHWTASSWVEALELHHVIGDALRAPCGEEDFEYVKTMSLPNLRKLMNEANLGGLVEDVWAGITELTKQEAATAGSLATKFASEASFGMSYGGLDVFYLGLEGLIGPPQMIHGSLMAGMKREHNECPDSKLTFTTSNGCTTTAITEWEFVVEPRMDKVYPEREGFAQAHPEWCRKPIELEQFKPKMDAINVMLVDMSQEPICVEELVSARLYTGPMYAKYNAVLRANSDSEYLQSLEASLCMGNKFATTIHSINSAVLKLSKLTVVCRVWRGFKDATLPAAFWEANEHGVRGGVEYGFTSCTKTREQALIYSAGKAPTLLEMRQGMVDRGADMSWLSVYPHEDEVLFPPLMGLEATRARVDGGTLLVEARISLNEQALTLEQVVSKRRKMVREMCDQMKGELELEVEKRYLGSDWDYLLQLWPEAGDHARDLLVKWHHRYSDHSPAYYNHDNQFKDCIQEAVDAVHICKEWPDGLARLLDQMGANGGTGAETMENLLDQTELNLDSRCWDWGTLLAAGATALLTRNNELSSLNLGHNQMSPSSLRGVAMALEENTNLTDLHLHYNHVTPDVAWVLGKALHMNSGLTSLDLRSCGLEAEGAKLICRGMQNNKGLKKLILMSNDLCDAAVPYICGLFRNNVVLEAVDLRSNGFGRGFDARAFIAAIRVNESLQGKLREVDLRPGGTTPNRLGNDTDALDILRKYLRESAKEPANRAHGGPRVMIKLEGERKLG